MIHPTAEIENGAEVGEGTVIWRWTHVRSTACIGRDCLIGSGVYVDSDVIVGDRVKIENQAKIYLPTRIGDGAFIGPGACLTNDRFPRATHRDGSPKGRTDWTAEGIVVEEGASIGAMVTVLPGLMIGRWSMVGAGSTVLHDVAPHALVVGNPADQIGWVCACGDRLDATLSCTCGQRYRKSSDGLVRHGD